MSEEASSSSVKQADPLKSPTGSRKRLVDTISLNEPTEKVPKIVSPVKNECVSFYSLIYIIHVTLLP